MKIECDNPTEVAKEMFWLAWQACGGPMGMGFLQSRPDATRDDVWRAVSGQEATDYAMPRGEMSAPYGDYVFGRMMKLGVEIGDGFIKLRESTPRPDYQSWCREYPTYLALAEAAVAALSTSA